MTYWFQIVFNEYNLPSYPKDEGQQWYYITEPSAVLWSSLGAVEEASSQNTIFAHKKYFENTFSSLLNLKLKIPTGF